MAFPQVAEGCIAKDLGALFQRQEMPKREEPGVAVGKLKIEVGMLLDLLKNHQGLVILGEGCPLFLPGVG